MRKVTQQIVHAYNQGQLPTIEDIKARALSQCDGKHEDVAAIIACKDCSKDIDVLSE